MNKLRIRFLNRPPAHAMNIRSSRRRVSFFNRAAKEEGFSIIEVLAAIVLLGVVTLGTVPLFVSGLKSTLTAKFETAAKNLSQERFELMRNLPFYVASSIATPPGDCSSPGRTDPRTGPAPGGVVECDYKDLLDTYYRSNTPAASPNVSGYVAANSARSGNEIAAGVQAPFYRYVIDPVPTFQNNRFSQVVLTQFMNASRTVLAPATTYNTQSSNFDLPPSRFIGATVITRWVSGSNNRKFVVFSQIAQGGGGLEGAPAETSVILQAQATALRMRTSSDSSGTIDMQMEAGISRSDGSIANGPSASTFAQGAYGQLTPGDRVDGRNCSASMPPKSECSHKGNGGSFNVSAGNPTYTGVSFGASDVSNVTADNINGQPYVPASNPGSSFSTGSLLRSAASSDFTFTNGAPGALTGIPALDPNRPLVVSKVGGSGAAASGGTYLKSEPGAGHYAESGARASVQQFQMFPTTFASGGVIQVELLSASIVCKTNGTATTGTISNFDVRIKYFSGASGSYVTLPAINQVIAPATNKLPDPASIVVDVAAGLTLANYIRDWSVLSSATVTPTTPPNSVSANLNGIIHITTQNSRPLDDSSAVIMDVGILSCLSEDKRI